VQSGGSFDVDYKVEGPNGKVILDGQKERQGDFVFTATQAGEYAFCFDNEMSTFAEKFVDFEISVRRTHVARLVATKAPTPVPKETVADLDCFLAAGRERGPNRQAAFQARHISRADQHH
jgi:hypothetical protein